MDNVKLEDVLPKTENVTLTDVSLLKPHPENYKKHPQDQLEHISKSIQENGINRKMREIIEHNGAHPRQTMKLVRKLASHYKKPWLLSERNFEADIKKYCSEITTNITITNITIKH